MDPVFFHEWLKRRRKALDLTQEELARRAGCSVGALRKIESGDRRPSKQLAGLLARALEIPPADQPVFIRVARGELNLERLDQPSLAPPVPLPDISGLRPIRPAASSSPGAAPISPAIRIPFQATPVIGRDAELAALERLFNDPQCRLLTLTGVGGIGKTRLAIEFAACHYPQFPGGVYYIPLTSINSPQKIVPTIADVLDFGFSGPTDPQEQLFNYISSNIKQKALFIFDNLEHLLVQIPAQEDKPGLVELVAEFLRRLPDVRILGTSRERLNIYGEWTYELHGLSVPPTSFTGPLEEYDAITLFVKSAQRIRTRFHEEDKDQLSLVRICQLVEGVPLAIELAAAWVGILSCQEIAQEIQSNMDFLATTMRNIPERHRSIRATFDHSWNLLTDGERWALSQLSVFHGGFDRLAANQVAGASLSLLASLSAKSLVRCAESGRYDLHEVIRQYALSHLNEHPDSRGTYERHCEYYLKYLGDCEKSLKSAAQQEVFRRLTGEIDNIRAAWSWAIQHEKYSQLNHAGRAFGWYFEIAGLYREGIEQFESLVMVLKPHVKDDQERRLLGLSFIHQALLYFRKGEFEDALRLYEESIALLRPTGDQILLADALIFLGILQHLSGEYDSAISSVEEGLVFARACNDPWFEAYAIYNLGYIASLMGQSSEGYKQMVAGLATWRTLGDPHYIALGLNFLVPTLTKLGRYQEAKDYMRESIALCEQAKNRWGMGTAYRYLGLACLAGGQFTEAQAHIQKSLDIFADISEGWDIARSLTYMGDATRMAGEFTAARKNYLDALQISIETKAIPITLDAFVGLGCLYLQAGNLDLALRFCRFILNHPSSEDETKQRAQQLCAEIEKTIGPERARALHTDAQNETLESMAEMALEMVQI